MWLNPPPTLCSTLPPESGCSPPASSSPLNTSGCEGSLWAVVSGTPVLRPRSWNGWKSRKAAARLFGTMRKPSSDDAAVDWNRWMSSAQGIPVSRFRPLASDLATAILGTCGPRCVESLRGFNRASCFSRTSMATSQWGCGKSFGIANDSAIALRRGCIARRKLARRIFASECSFSGWLTPAGVAANHGPDGSECAEQASLWASPQGAAAGATSRSGERIEELLLGGQASRWARPTAHDVTARGAGQTTEANGAGNACLNRDATNWPSARAEDSESCGNHPEATDSLTGAVSARPTPEANNGSKAPKLHAGGNPSLNTASQTFAMPLARPTATNRDWKVGDLPPECRVGTKALTAAAESFPSTLHTEPTTDAGLNLLLSVWTRPCSPRLSPAFQWWLMGWPHPLIFFGWEETESARSRQPGRSSISRAASYSAWKAANLHRLDSLIKGATA